MSQLGVYQLPIQGLLIRKMIFAESQGGFMVRTIKWVPVTPTDCRAEGFEFNPLKVVPFFKKKSSYAMLSQNLISIFSPLFLTHVVSQSNKENKLKGM